MIEPAAPLLPSLSPRLKRVLQATLTIALVGFAAWYLWSQWNDASAAHLRLDIDPLWLAAATAIVLATYLLLVDVWRRVLARFGNRLALRDAARVWFVSNLGKYVPGKVWQITTMTSMLSELGVPVTSAASASVVITIANVVAGFALLLVAGTPSLRAIGGRYQSAVFLATLILVAALLAAPFMMGTISSIASRVLRRPVTMSLPLAAVWISIVGCAVAWLLYGSAFQLLVLSLLGSARAPWLSYVAAYTLSYLIGYLAVFAIGGIGVREVTLAALLVALQLATPAEATVITVVSRLWLTVLEIAPALLFLLVRPARISR